MATHYRPRSREGIQTRMNNSIYILKNILAFTQLQLINLGEFLIEELFLNFLSFLIIQKITSKFLIFGVLGFWGFGVLGLASMLILKPNKNKVRFPSSFSTRVPFTQKSKHRCFREVRENTIVIVR